VESSPSTPVLDVRPRPVFEAGHTASAAHIALEELASRSHELPRDRGAELLVWDDDPARRAAALSWLHQRGYAGATALHPARTSTLPSATGPARARLWQPNGWLERCWPRIAAGLAEAVTRSQARALDLACGSGRDAVWLAERGLDVEAVDHLPDALARAGDLATRCGVALQTRAQDLEVSPQLSAERYDLVTCFCFLSRPLMPQMAAALRPGGFVCVRTFDAGERARTGRPRRERFVLHPGELARAFGGLEICAEETGPDERGRLTQALLARRA
jgi:2-polyprenyl-3-methyl-5-hydroxy-6-metoxy-1,4-benzoquinol methylase